MKYSIKECWVADRKRNSLPGGFYPWVWSISFLELYLCVDTGRLSEIVETVWFKVSQQLLCTQAVLSWRFSIGYALSHLTAGNVRRGHLCRVQRTQKRDVNVGFWNQCFLYRTSRVVDEVPSWPFLIWYPYDICVNVFAVNARGDLLLYSHTVVVTASLLDCVPAVSLDDLGTKSEANVVDIYILTCPPSRTFLQPGKAVDC